jgi:methyl-accepting chemotaxis protein
VPVGLQVLIGVGSLVVLFVASILLAIFLVVELNDQSRQLSAHAVPFATAVDEAALAAKGAANDSRGFLISGNEIYVEEFARRVSETDRALATASRHATSEAELKGTARVTSQFGQWVLAARREFSAYVAGRRQAAVVSSLGPDRALRKRYEASLALAGRQAQDAIRTGDSSYAGASRRAVRILLVALLVSLALGLGVAIWVVRRILKPVYSVLRLFTAINGPIAGAPQSDDLREASDHVGRGRPT